MEKIDNIYLINLERRPDRRQHFLQQCQKENIPLDKVSRIQAIDGLKHVINNKELCMFSKTDFVYKYMNSNRVDYTMNRLIGNQLSHYYTLCEIIKKEFKYTIIFQDDAILIPNFVKYIDNIMNNLPDDSEIINIGLHKKSMFNEFESWEFNTETDDTEKISSQFVNKYICKLKPELNPSSLAYIISLDGAKKIVNHFNNVGFKRATDYNFNEYLINNNIFYSSNIILVTGNPEFRSDVFV